MSMYIILHLSSAFIQSTWCRISGHLASKKCPPVVDNPGASTINRLYSYLSGSDGEGEAPPHPPGSGRMWEARRKSPSSSCSSISANGSSCASDSPCDPEEMVIESQNDQATDTMDSSGIGENVYSRIKDSGRCSIHLNFINISSEFSTLPVWLFNNLRL